MTVWIVGNCEVFTKKESALALVRRCLIDSFDLHFRDQQPDRYRAAMLLLKEDVELALNYWNDHRPLNGTGTGAHVNLREAEVRED